MTGWEGFRIKPPINGASRGNVHELTEVNHVVHPAAARRILDNGCIEAGIVHDESRMNRTRNRVVWLSANVWEAGSLYGTVQFTFPWKRLIAERRLYWVESKDYGNPAYRILVTDKDRSDLRFLTPYNPSIDKGPVRKWDGKWYWNSASTSEFLIEANLDLSDCVGVAGIRHRDGLCRLHGARCSKIGVSPYLAAGRILAFLLATGNHNVDNALRLVPPGLSRVLSPDVDNGVLGIHSELARHESTQFGGPLRLPASARSIVLGALALFGSDRGDEARRLVALLKDEGTFNGCLQGIVNEHFGTRTWTLRV